jgi:hypothetical protein
MLSIYTYRSQEDEGMTKKNANRYADKHGKDIRINPLLAEIIKKKVSKGKLPCAVAFKIAEETGVSPAEVGINLDLLEIKLSKCQIGIFGYEKDSKIVKAISAVSEDLEKAVRENLKDGKLACREAWNIAERLGIGKIDVSSACDGLGIKISPCQLGAF